MTSYIVQLDEAEGEQMARRATERGYRSVVDYLRALVAADVLIDALRDDWQDADDTPDVLEANFREAWHDAMTENTLPVEQLWDTVDDDE